jgi:hypothetical protein
MAKCRLGDATCSRISEFGGRHSCDACQGQPRRTSALYGHSWRGGATMRQVFSRCTAVDLLGLGLAAVRLLLERSAGVDLN